MYKVSKSISLVFLFLLTLFFITSKVSAVELSVEAPQETLKIGEVFDFKINIDTKGQSVNKQEFYVTYEKQYIEFQAGGFYAGNFFEDIQYSPVEDGKIYVIATNSSVKSGTGNIAVIKFKIIATAPGSAVLCAVLPITPTPTPGPTSSNSCNQSCTPGSCGNSLVCNTNVNPPVCLNPNCPPDKQVNCVCQVTTPTALPKSGSVQQVLAYSTIAFGLILTAIVLRMI